MRQALPTVRRMGYRVASKLDRAANRGQAGVFVLCYHSISESDWPLAVGRASLARQLEYLLASCTPLAIEQMDRVLSGQVQLNRPSFLLTFDDGYRDILDAYPLFQDAGIRPLVSALSNPLESLANHIPRGYEFLTGDDLRALHAAGWHIGSHSASHADLTGLDAARLQYEVSESRKRLQDAVGAEVNYFAYPRGRYDAAVAQACATAGYTAAFSMDDGYVSSRTNLYAIPRIGVNGTHSLDEFKTLMSPSSMRLRRLIKRSPLAGLF